MAGPLAAGSPVQETAREFSAAGDFNGDGFADVLVLDKTSGLYRIGYSSAAGALTFAEARPGGLDRVTGCAVGKLIGTVRDSFAVTTPTANRAHILSPLTPGYTEAKPAQDAGVGGQLLAAFDLPAGPVPSAEDDLISFAVLDPVMGNQIRTLRSSGGGWTLLNQTNAAEGAVSQGTSIIPAAAAAPLFAYVREAGVSTVFHAWQSNGLVNNEVLTATSLPPGSGFVAATFETPRADVIFYTPGQAGVRVRPILPAAPWAFGAEAAFDFGSPLEQLVAVNDPAGTKLLTRFSNGSLALFGYTMAGGFSAPQMLTPTGAAGVPSGIVPMPGAMFHLLFAPAAGQASTTAVTFRNNGTRWVQTAVTALPGHRPLAASANVQLLAGAPFHTENVAVLRSYRTADWSTGVSVGGGPISITAQSASYGGVSQGIGAPATQLLGTVGTPPGGTSVNQGHPQFSLFHFTTTLGATIDHAAISPDPGTYATAVQINFSGMGAGSTVHYRRSPAAAFAAWSTGAAPWIFTPATVEYYVRTSSGVVSPTLSASYAFSKPPALQDQDGDGVPDFVEIARGLNPAGGPDHDGDGFSDREEIAANTNPNQPASKPATAFPDLNTMLVDLSASLQDTTTTSVGRPFAGTVVTVSDPFGNPVGSGSTGSLGSSAEFARVTAVGVLPALEFLIARTPEHFDATPPLANVRHGREMVAIIPVTPAEPWSFGPTEMGTPSIRTPWSWGGVNWMTGSTNWNAGLGEADGFDAGWSASQQDSQWGGLALGYTFGAWEIGFRNAANRGSQPYVNVTLTPVTSITALIAAQLIGDQLALRAGVAVEGTSLVFDPSLAGIFQGLRHRDPAHPAAPSFRIQSLLRDLDSAIAAADSGATALRKIARSVYIRHAALAPDALATLPMPLTALADLVNTGALPPAYDLTGTGLTAGDLTNANAKLTALSALLVTRPSAAFGLLTRSIASPQGLTLVQNSIGAIYHLTDSSLSNFALPPGLPANTPLSVMAYTDLPLHGGRVTLEVISLQISDLPFLVGPDSDGDLLADLWELRHRGNLSDSGTNERDGSGYQLLQEYLSGTDPGSAASSPPLPPVNMELSDFKFAGSPATPRLSVHWPAAYAGAISVNFAISSDLGQWISNPGLNGVYAGDGVFVREISLSGPRSFYRPGVSLRP